MIVPWLKSLHGQSNSARTANRTIILEEAEAQIKRGARAVYCDQSVAYMTVSHVLREERPSLPSPDGPGLN